MKPYELDPTLQRYLTSEGYVFRNRTLEDRDTGRELQVFTERNGSLIAVLFIDGRYVSHQEYSARELALMADYS